MKTWKKILVLPLTAVLVTILLSSASYAEETVQPDPGKEIQMEEEQPEETLTEEGQPEETLTEEGQPEEIRTEALSASKEGPQAEEEDETDDAETTETILTEPEKEDPDSPETIEELPDGPEAEFEGTEPTPADSVAGQKESASEADDEGMIESEEEISETEAADGIAASGSCGENAVWALDENGILTISGSGTVKQAPALLRPVSEIIITEGITTLFAEEFDLPTFQSYDKYKNVEKVTLPDSLTAIGASAFAGCENLKEVVGGNGLRVISDYAFSRCSSLHTIQLNDGVSEIGQGAFDGCALRSIHIPSSLSKIKKYAFCRNAFSEVEIPDNITEIGELAFWNNQGLTTVHLGNGVTSLGKQCFYRCESLTAVYFDNAPAAIGNKAFSECRALESIVISDGIISIGDEAFASCDELQSVTIGNGVQSIGYSLFASCPKLTQIVVGSENPVYSSGSEGDNIIFNKTTGEIVAAVKTSRIPNGVTSIGPGAFAGWSGQELVIPGSVKTIGNGAFKDAQMTSLVIENGVATIGDWAFYGCAGIQEVTLPESVTKLGSHAFENCTGLKKVSLGSNINTIEYSAFSKCSALTELIILEGIKSLQERAFYDCTSLKEIEIPSSVTAFGLYAVGYHTVCENEVSEDPDYYPDLLPDVNILGVPGSAAERYAARNHLLFNGGPVNAITFFVDDIEEIPDQIYTGEAIEPKVELIPAAEEQEMPVALARDVDYTVQYKNNKKVGEAAVVVKGIGNYSGSMTKEFRIRFSDVPADHSFAKAIYWANQKGIISGYRDGSFKPGKAVTRGDFVMMLWKAAGRPDPQKSTQTFRDVPVSSNYYKPVQWAAENKITTGYTKGAKKGSFGVKDPVTRGQLAMFLWRYAEKPEPAAAGQYFTDVPVSHSYYKAIQWAYQRRITAGTGNDCFSPGGVCTRAHCTQFLYKLLR